MQIIKKILILLVIVFIFVFYKEDIKQFINNNLNKLKEEAKTFSFVNNEKNKVNLSDQIRNDIKDINTIDNIKTPGAIIINDNIYKKETKLSKEGILNITNKYRKENNNLKELKENPKLNFSAEKKVQDMIVNQYFEHVSPNGVGVANLADSVSYEYIIVGENLAYGNFTDDKNLVDAWMASPGHRANILNKNYTEIGISVVEGKMNGKNVWVAVQHFGLPKNFCPTIDEVLSGIIKIKDIEIKKTEADLIKRKGMIDNKALYDNLSLNEQIQKYNEIVFNYNKSISELKESINKYNEQIKKFNACVSSIVN